MKEDDQVNAVFFVNGQKHVVSLEIACLIDLAYGGAELEIEYVEYHAKREMVLLVLEADAEFCSSVDSEAWFDDGEYGHSKEQAVEEWSEFQNTLPKWRRERVNSKSYYDFLVKSYRRQVAQREADYQKQLDEEICRQPRRENLGAAYRGSRWEQNTIDDAFEGDEGAYWESQCQ